MVVDESITQSLNRIADNQEEMIDVLKVLDTKKEEKDNNFINYIEKIRKYNNVFIYMPTWRDTDEDFITESKIDFNELNNLFKRNNSILILKFHPNTKLQFNKKEFSNIVLYEKNIDLYSFLPFTNVLITDYSSIYYDYLLLKKEAVLFLFDIERYISDNRAFNYDFEKYTGCHKAYNYKQLLKITDNLLKTDNGLNTSDCKKKSEELMSIFWGTYKGNACEKLYKIVNSL